MTDQLNTHVAIPVENMNQITALVGECPTKYGAAIMRLLETGRMVHIAQPPAAAPPDDPA